MRKVITINLNNNAYQIDEDGYEALRAYLDTATRKLADNPDRAEILIDLEQAIGDKCRACLGPHKSVVSSAEIQRVLEEMGPVEGTAPDAPGTTSSTGAAASAAAAPGVKRLFRLDEGSMWAGACTGLAAYIGIDVVWMRLTFILLTLFTGGIWLIVYIALIFIMPRAETPEQVAAAHGAAFNAQELVDRLKKKPERFRSRPARMRRAGFGGSRYHSAFEPGSAPGAAARVTGGLFLPVLTIMSAAWFATMLFALFVVWSVYEPGGLSAWGNGLRDEFWWTPQLPRWIAVVAILAVYALLAMPIGAGRRASLYYANGGRLHGWADAWSGLLWLALVATMLWVAWYTLPGVQQMLRGLFNGTQTVFVQAYS